MKRLKAIYVMGLVIGMSHVGVWGQAPTYDFSNEVTTNLIDFETLGVGADVGVATGTWTTPWTGDTTGNLGAIPLSPLQNDSDVALGSPSDRTHIWSNQQTPTADFLSADTIVLSSWIRRISSNASGGRIQIGNANNAGSGVTGKIAGWGVMDGSGHSFAVYSVDTSGETPSGSWVQSEVFGAPTLTWLEMKYVIELNHTDYSQSVGHLFYRAVGTENFTYVSDISGHQMSWWDQDLNYSDFAYFRVENFRNAQIDNLSAGYMIPEPAVAGLVMLSLGVLGMGRRKKS